MENEDAGLAAAVGGDDFAIFDIPGSKQAAESGTGGFSRDWAGAFSRNNEPVVRIRGGRRDKCRSGDQERGGRPKFTQSFALEAMMDARLLRVKRVAGMGEDEDLLLAQHDRRIRSGGAQGRHAGGRDTAREHPNCG